MFTDPLCTAQLGCITLNNAGNCNTMMKHLERLLAEKGVPFHRDGNKIRYTEWNTRYLDLRPCETDIYLSTDASPTLSTSPLSTDFQH